MSTGLATAAAPKPRSALSRFFSAENRYLSPLFITVILLVGNLSFGLLESFSRTLLAIGTALVLEVVLGRLVLGQSPEPGQRLYHRHQRGHSAALAGILALCALQRHRHHLQVCDSLCAAGTSGTRPISRSAPC